MPPTVDQLKQAAESLEPGASRFVKVRECSICDASIGFVVCPEGLYFDRGCGCTRYRSPLEPRDWADAIAFIQASEDQAAAAKSFGVE
jgi:hypothetical protein